MYPKHSVYGHLGVWVDLPGPLGSLGFRNQGSKNYSFGP